MITVINHKFKASNDMKIIDTTSRSFTWSRSLSPFLLGPVDLYDSYKSLNVENGWQYSKCFYNQVDENDNPNQDYFDWAIKGWNSLKANRYPMGKGAVPLFSYWDGEKLTYTEARKKIYIPLYSKAVQKIEAFDILRKMYKNNEDFYLLDFDAHNLTPGTFNYWDLWNNPNIKVGHAYVIAMLLEGIIA